MSYRRYYTPRRESAERPSRNCDPTLQLERDRIANDLKLKGRFEHIFAKYARDFQDVGDEIDMETGNIVVDNGHIAFMKHERDVGSSASSRFLAAFEDELEEEEADGGTEDGGQEDVDDDSEDELAPGRLDDPAVVDETEQDDELDEVLVDHPNSQRASVTHLSRPRTPLVGYSADNSDDRGDELDESSEEDTHTHLPIMEDRNDRPHSRSATSSSERDLDNDTIIPSTELSLGLPSISMENSMNALVSHQDESGRIDPAAIQDLGLSIANQIADFLMRATAGRLNHQPYLPHVSRDPWSVPPLPRDSFRRPKPLDESREMTPREDRYPSVMNSPGASSLWAPASSAGQRRPNKRHKKDHSTGQSGRLLQQRGDGAAPIHDNHDGSALLSGADSRDQSETPEPGSRAPPHAFATGRPYPPHFNSAGKKFRKEEDDLLKRLRDLDGLSWQQMTIYFPGRTPVALQSRYTRALKHLPRPVVVKREIIEIMDGEDESQSVGTPNWRLLPPAQGQVQTPLAQNGFRGFDGRSYTPISVTDDDDDDNEDSEPTPFHPAHSGGPPQGYSYQYPYPPLPPEYYYAPSPGQYQYPYNNAFLPSNGMWYPQMPPLDPKVSRPKSRSKKNRGKPEAQRYTRFDTTQGDGRFGILRADKPIKMTSTPQQHVLGTRTDTTGAFGVLKIKRPNKARKLPKPTSRGNDPGNREVEPPAVTPLHHPSHDPNLASFQTPGTAPGVLQLMPPLSPYEASSPLANVHTSGPEMNARHSPSPTRDLYEPPHTTAYPESRAPAAENGPYYLSNISQAIAHDPDGGVPVHLTIEEDQDVGRSLQESSPLLPTPPSDSSVKHTVAPVAPVGMAPLAQMVATPVTAPSKMAATIYDTPRRPYASPTPGDPISRSSSRGTARKRAIPFGDPESEDELA